MVGWSRRDGGDEGGGGKRGKGGRGNWMGEYFYGGTYVDMYVK